MIEASRRAAGPARRGGLPNALFVVAAAEAMPPELNGVAEVVTIHLPWGSLLRGALAIDEAVAAGIAGLVAPGGRVEILLAPATRDQLDDAIDVGERIGNGLADDWRQFGLGLREAGLGRATRTSRAPAARGPGVSASVRATRIARRSGSSSSADRPIRADILAACTAAPARTASRRRGS